MDQLDLSDFFTTKPGASNFAEQLEVISQSIYKSDFNLEHVLMEQFGLHKKDIFMTMLQNNSIAIDSAAALKEFFDKLREKILTLPMVTLTIAFEPTETTMQKLSQWFLLQNNMQVLFDVSVNPNLIGGAEIAFNGKHLDFSIRPVFEKIVKTMLTENPGTTRSTNDE